MILFNLLIFKNFVIIILLLIKPRGGVAMKLDKSDEKSLDEMKAAESVIIIIIICFVITFMHINKKN